MLVDTNNLESGKELKVIYEGEKVDPLSPPGIRKGIERLGRPPPPKRPQPRWNPERN